MNIREIQRLVKLVERSAISEIDIEEKGLKIRISKNSSHGQQTIVYAPPLSFGQPPIPTGEAARSLPSEVSALPKIGIIEVKSPMVGTFYRSPAPDAEPYVRIGDHVEPGRVLCIIEAMKLMNEIEAEVAGTIIEILPESTQPVEFGQILFRIDTSR
ncbi:MAG: acetyl-CoA carboxylase biotin carboxyl carrier protein [bacterium]